MNSPQIQPFRRIGLVGFGLMGGSLARALKALPEPPHIRAVAGNPEDLEEGSAAGVLDEASVHGPALFEGLDLLIYATPLGPTLELMGDLADLLEPETLVTDLVSLKAPVLERMQELGLSHRFIGGHPMAGGEGRGFSASDGKLFQDARVWMAVGDADSSSIARIVSFWEGIGARPAFLGAKEHDEMMVWVSHLPQLVATSLATALARSGFAPEDLGRGGRDMTRLAGSTPEMWEELFRRAPQGLGEALGSVQGQISEFRELLDRGSVEEISARMHQTRRWLKEGEWS